jgi:hypothetical protein
MTAVAHRATVNRHHLLGKARRADRIIFLQMISARRKPLHCRPVGPEKSGSERRPGDFVPRHPLCRPAGPEESPVGPLGLNLQRLTACSVKEGVCCLGFLGPEGRYNDCRGSPSHG